MPIPVVPCTPDHCGQTDVPMIFRLHTPRTCPMADEDDEVYEPAVYCDCDNGTDAHGYLIVCTLAERHAGPHHWSLNR